MVTIVYRAESVGPVCERVARSAPESIRVVRDSQSVPTDGVIVRWGSLYRGDGACLNTAEAVATAKDHVRTRQILSPEGLCPPTWFREGDIPAGTPVVVRPMKHFGGSKFYVARTARELAKAVRICGRRGRTRWYASELVGKAREFRVFVCLGRVVAVSERFPADPSAIAWNLAMGGKLINVKHKVWPIPVLKAALAAALKLGLDWCALDLALTTDGRVVVFEANTAPGLRNPHTINCIADVFEWVDEHGTTGLGPVRGEKWSKFIHPSLLA